MVFRTEYIYQCPTCGREQAIWLDEETEIKDVVVACSGWGVPHKAGWMIWRGTA